MAKKKKPAGRRQARRVDKAMTGDGDTLSIDSASSSSQSAPSDQGTSSTAPTQPTFSENTATTIPSTAETTTAGHPPKPTPTVTVPLKKFGKYRCLFNSDDLLKKYESSDSETNSNLEIRIVDPCASSESDSNNTQDTQSDTASGTPNFSPVHSAASTGVTSGNSSPTLLTTEYMNSVDSLSQTTTTGLEHFQETEMCIPQPLQIPLPPKKEIIAVLQSSQMTENDLNEQESDSNEKIEASDLDSNVENTLPPSSEDLETRMLNAIHSVASIPMPQTAIKEQFRSECIPLLGNLDEVQAVPECIPIPDNVNKVQTPTEAIPLPDDIKEVPTECIPMPENFNEVQAMTESDQMVEGYNNNQDETVDQDDEEVITIFQIVEEDDGENGISETYYNIEMSNVQDINSQPEIQEDFEKLNLTTKISAPTSPMECDRPSACNTPDMNLTKDSLDIPPRPDPSLTPSSTISDDSNSSRVNSEQNPNNSNDSAESSPTGVRRSSRIKTISNLKQKTKGYGLVKTPLKKALMSQTKLKLEELGSDSQEKLEGSSAGNSPSFPIPSEIPVKVKSRWRRSSELEMCVGSPVVSPLASPSLPSKLPPVSETDVPKDDEIVPLSKAAYDKIIEDRMKQYQHLDENDYLCDRMISRDAKKMICDCFLTKEETERGELGCGEDCLNRLLMIECNYRCPVGDRCTNRRFQKMENGPLQVFYADKKGCGVNAKEDISSGEFLMEYVGEVLDYELFYKRAQAYSADNNLHHYFMSLKGDTVIDATLKGNISRFINHSCDPNAETQKWTVNGELRIGFFSKRDIQAGEEITFDYQFQRFGKEAQRCYCGADTCRGWIGAEPDSDDDDEEEEDGDVSTSKSPSSGAADATLPDDHKTPAKKKKQRKDRRKYAVAGELVQDADIEEDIEALSRTGIKNQSHTLRLSRTMVRAKTIRCQTSLLRLLRDADLPCRRLFLDYRGLRLLAPWCSNADLQFRVEMLSAVDRLPITNKTMVQESRFLQVVDRWAAEKELPNTESSNDGASAKTDKSKDASVLEKVRELSKQLLERWSSLKEVFKIPKKERIQQMKEHERQANVERRAADSSGARDRDRTRPERDRDRERERDRDREREKERDKERDRRDRDRERERERERDDRDRRKRRTSPDGRRSIRLSDRVLASVPPMSKEERRRAFAEAAAAAEQSRAVAHYQHWPPDMQQVYGGGGAEWGGAAAHYYPGPPYCVPQTFMGMPGFNMGGFMFNQLPQPQELPQPPQQQHQVHQPPPPQHTQLPTEPVRLPSLWRSATDPRGRTYYYHVKLRQPTWVPPPPPNDNESSSEEEAEEETFDTSVVQRKGKLVEGLKGIYEVAVKNSGLIPEHALVSRTRKRRPGLVAERPISPRTEEDKLAGRMEVKRYKQTKEKLRRRRERFIHKLKSMELVTKDLTSSQLANLVDLDDSSESDVDDLPVPSVPIAPVPTISPVPPVPTAPVPPPPEPEVDVEEPDEVARRIKETFRSNMARVMVHHLNPYRHRTASAGRITNTADFKHLARKLTHFVMLKELKHCRSVEELIVTDSVKNKAKEFVKKYMAKFGPVYKRPAEEAAD